MKRALRALRAVRGRAGALVVDNAFRVASRLGRLHPDARPERHGLEVVRDVAYRATDRWEHRLDVYRPRERAGPLPAVLYVHGGAFRILSKDTHWIMGLAFARRGMVVFNISYRLAPKHPYPAAVEDACAAYEWVARNAAAHGGDASRLVLAGESAGANLVTALALCACYERPEPFARALFDTGVVPRAVLPACGLYQVTNVQRLVDHYRLPFFLADRLHEVERDYLRGALRRGVNLDLADPLLVLERGDPPARPLPPFFAFVGTKDPLLPDTQRLAAAIERLGGACEARYYEGEPHAFHAAVFRRPARRAWRDMYEFLDRHVGRAESSADVPEWLRGDATPGRAGRGAT